MFYKLLLASRRHIFRVCGRFECHFYCVGPFSKTILRAPSLWKSIRHRHASCPPWTTNSNALLRLPSTCLRLSVSALCNHRRADSAGNRMRTVSSSCVVGICLHLCYSRCSCAAFVVPLHCLCFLICVPNSCLVSTMSLLLALSLRCPCYYAVFVTSCFLHQTVATSTLLHSAPTFPPQLYELALAAPHHTPFHFTAAAQKPPLHAMAPERPRCQ